MRVDVDLRAVPAETVLREPADFTSLKVVVRGDPDRLRSATSSLGQLAEDERHLFLAPAALVALAGPLADDPAWRQGFDAMVAYAREQGWTDGDDAVRAHIELVMD